MLGDLFEIAGKHLNRFVDLSTLFVVQYGDDRSGGRFQLVEQLDRKSCEIIDEIERILDLVGNARSQLAERGHLLRLDQTGLGGFQITISGFGGIPSSTNLG